MVGDHKPPGPEVALAEALDRLVYEQDPYLPSCTKNQVHLS